MLDTATPDGTLTLSASAFKARCLEVFKALEARKLARVVVTRRGRPVAELVPPRGGDASPSLWGAHRGSVTVAPGVDLTEPVLDEPLDAELGVLHR
jgi:antitoxin (DNA-binding transcriptional repressor) of toxin-antitoxin stability system